MPSSDNAPMDAPSTDQSASTEVTVKEEDNGARLDKWLSDQLNDLTRSRLKALIEGGALARNGETFTDPSWKIKIGETFRLTMPEIVAATPKPEAIPLDVYFEDDHVIVINKPAGMVVHPAAGNWSGTLVNALIAHCGDSLSGVGGVARPGIVHRLDKDTSGLIVVAKHDAAHQKLTAAFAVHDIERVYEAICVGAPRPSVGVVDAPIIRLGGDRKKMGIAKPKPATIAGRAETPTFIDLDAGDDEDPKPQLPPGARHAVTHYKTLAFYGRGRAKIVGDAVASRIECRLETGRTHQIRVHMSHIGAPLIGDPVYGRGPGLPGLRPGDEPADAALAVLGKFKRQALHARTLGFIHPETGEEMRFEAPAPADLDRLVQVLEAL